MQGGKCRCDVSGFAKTNQSGRSGSSGAEFEFASLPSDELSGQARWDKWLLIIHIPPEVMRCTDGKIYTHVGMFDYS